MTHVLESERFEAPLTKSEAPGWFERGGAALKLATLAVGPTAALAPLLDFIPASYGLLQVYALALALAALTAGAGQIARWMALGSSPFVDRALVGSAVAATLAGAAGVEFHWINDRVTVAAGAMTFIPVFGVLVVYWAIASIFLAQDGESRRGRFSLQISDVSLALALVGLYSAAARWAVLRADPPVLGEWWAILLGTMIVGVLCLIPFAIDLACRFAARSSRRWILAIVPFAAPFGAGVAIAWDVPPRMTQIPVFAVLSFALASYLVLAAVLAALSEWRPLLADLRALDRGIFSQEQ